MDSDPIAPEKMSHNNFTSDSSNSIDMNGQNGAPAVETKNSYVSKKTIAQGMFDVALLSSNTNQLVQLINTTEQYGGTISAFHITAITLLIMSIILQVIVGGCLIVIAVYKRPNDPQRKVLTRRLNNITTILIFFITILNVIIPSFTPTLVHKPS